MKSELYLDELNPMALLEEAKRMHRRINSAVTADFTEAVTLEAAHQIERWGVGHDRGKSAFDWFWLVGYLAQKAAHAHEHGEREKALHHTISTAAALCNWHKHIIGDESHDPTPPAAIKAQGEAAL